MKRIAEKAIWLWLLFLVFDAPLRFIFADAGAPFLIYIKDVLLFGLFLYVMLGTAFTLRINRTLLLILLMMFFGIVVGLLHRLPIVQVLFGTKIMLSFLIGFIVVTNMRIGEAFFVRLFRVLIPVVLVGIVLEIFFDLPWKGFEYEAFGTSIEGSRDWATFGLPRLSGFGRASYETAAILYSLVALYVGTKVNNGSPLTWRHRKYELLLLALAFLGIIVTTAKSAILALLALYLFYGTIQFYHRFRRWFRLLAGVVLKAILYGLCLFGIIPPAIAFVAPSIITRYLTSDDIVFMLIFSSYIDRVERMWPEAFDLISTPYQYLTGRGIGGIGTAQLYFEKDLYNAADNLYVYLSITFGFAVVAALVLYLLYKIYVSRLDSRVNIYFYLLCVTLFSFGATVNVVESAGLTMASGFMLAMWKQGIRNVC